MKAAARLLDATPQAVYAVDHDGTLTFANRAALDLLGNPEVGKPLFDGAVVVRDGDGTVLDVGATPLAVALRTGAPARDIPLTFERRDGSIVHVLSSPMLLHDDAGAVTGAVDFLVDVTALRHAEHVALRRFEALNKIANAIGREHDLDRIVGVVVAVAKDLLGAERGAFVFFDDPAAEMPALLAGGPVLSDDVASDPRFAQHGPEAAVRPGRSYLAVPVVSRTGKILGGLFLSHRDVGVFSGDSLATAEAIAAQAAIAIDNANLFRAGQDALAELREAEQQAQQLASIIETSTDAIVSRDRDGLVTSWNRGAERLFGYEEAEMLGRSISILIPSDRSAEEKDILTRIWNGEEIDSYETVRRRKDGSLVDVSLTVSGMLNDRGEIVGASKIARDISLRRRAEQQQRLLIGEIQHRIKNSLATAQAIANQTLGSASDEDRRDYIARLQALARAQELLTVEEWNRVPVADLVNLALRPFRAEPSDAFTIEGSPDVALDASKSTMLGMALHELATNSVKYGALSVEGGTVRIHWQEHDDRLEFGWEERGGPPVTPPTRSGFGSYLLERAFEGEPGKPHLDYRPEGLVCTLSITLWR